MTRPKVPKGSVVTPIPPDLIEEADSIVSPKTIMEFEREQDEYLRELRKRKGKNGRSV